MPDDPVTRALRHLRGHTTADLRFDEHLRPVRYVVDGQGHLVFPAMVAMLTAVETVLFVPDCAEHALEMLVTLEPLDEHGPDGGLTDRWRIYHGSPDDVRWARASIDSARFEGSVIDGDVMMRVNPLAGDEAVLCREMNAAGPEPWRDVCREVAGIDAERPLVVGIDPGGIDLRRRFDVVRLELPEPAPTADAARRAVDALRRRAAEGPAA